MPNNQELRLQQTQMLSHQDFRLQQTQCSQTKISGVHKQFHPPNKSITTTRQRGAYLPEHKIEVFVRFWGLEPSFSGLSSTKSGFLCAFRVWKPYFRASQAQNLHFCARSEGQVASGSVKVTFLQFTAHTSKTQMPHNQVINF